jgi:hypothetical protein
MFLRLTHILLYLVIGVTFPAWAKEPVHSSGVRCFTLARISGRPITNIDIIYRFLLWPKLQNTMIPREMFSQYASSIFRQILLERLQISLAEQYKISIPDAQFTQAYANWTRELKKNTPNLVLTSMDEQNLRDQLKANMLWDYYIEGRYGPEFYITQQETDLYKKKWKSRPPSLKQVRYGEIVLFYKTNPEEATQEMQKIKSMLDQGAPFAQLAFQFSQSESKKNYGIVDWVPERNLNPSLSKALSESEEGRIIGPLVIPNLRAVMCVVPLGRKTHEELGIKCPADEEIKNLLRQERKGLRVQQEIDKLLNGENYEIFEGTQQYLEHATVG